MVFRNKILLFGALLVIVFLGIFSYRSVQNKVVVDIDSNVEYLKPYVSQIDKTRLQSVYLKRENSKFRYAGQDSDKLISPKTVKVLLVNSPGSFDVHTTRVDGEKRIFKSFNVYFEEVSDLLEIQIYIDRSVYPEDYDFLSEINNYSLRAVFLATNPNYLESSDSLNQVDEIIKKLLTIDLFFDSFATKIFDLVSSPVYAQCSGFYSCGRMENDYSCNTTGGDQTCVNACTDCCGNLGLGDCVASGATCVAQGDRSCAHKGSASQCGDSSSGQCSVGQCVTSYACSWSSGGGGGPTLTPSPTTPPGFPTNTPNPGASCSNWCATAAQCSGANGTTTSGTCPGSDVCCVAGGGTPPQCDGARYTFNLNGSFNAFGGLDLSWISSSVAGGPGPSSFWSDPHHFNIKIYRNVNSPGTRIYENNSVPGSLPISYGIRSYSIPQSGANFLPGQSLSPGTYVVRVSGRDNCDSTDANMEITVCTPPQAPTVITPNPGFVSSGTSGANDATYYFGAAPGSTVTLNWNNTGATRYAIRIDDLSNSWNPGAMNPGDSMNDNVLTNSYTFTPTRGRSYRIWVHAVNCNGQFSSAIALNYNALVVGSVQGRLVDCPANTAVTVSGLGTYTMPTAQAGVSSWSYSAAMWGGDSRTVSVSIPGNYSAEYSLCPSCTSHSGYTPGSSLSVTQPNSLGAYNDLYFRCRPAASTYTVTVNPICASGTPNTALLQNSYQVGLFGSRVNLPAGQMSYTMNIDASTLSGYSWFYANGVQLIPSSVTPNTTWVSGALGSSMRFINTEVNPGSYVANVNIPASACVVSTPTPPTPFCTISNSPLTTNLNGGATAVVNSTITLGTGSTISQVRYGAYNTTIASVSPTSRSAAGPFSTTITASSANSGSTAVWATVDLVGRPAACTTSGSQDTDVNVTPLPPCSATVTLSDPGVLEAGGLSAPLTATVVPSRVGCVVNRVDFISGTTTVATVNPSNDSVSPYVTNINPLASGVSTINANAYIASTLVGTGTRPVNVACTAPAAPSNLNVTDAVFQIQLDWIDNSNNETGFVIEKQVAGVWQNIGAVGPNVTTFLETGDAICGVSSNYRVSAVNSGKPIACQNSAWASDIGGCEDYDSWYASGGGSVISSGNMQSNLPSWAPGPFAGISNVYMINDPVTGSGVGPGMAIASSFSGFTAAQANSQSWQEQAFGSLATLLSRSENSYQSMYERVTARVTPINVNQPVINSGNIDGVIGTPAASNIISGVTVLRRVGNVNINDLRLVNRRVLLFVEGNVDISDQANSGIGTSLDNNSFLAIIASGNITISPTVGDPNTTIDALGTTINLNTALDIRSTSYTPHLEGIFFASGAFATSGIDTSLNPDRHRLLRVDGSVIGMTGVGLQRSVKSPLPSTYVVFRPDLTYQLSQVGLRRKTFQELLNP